MTAPRDSSSTVHRPSTGPHSTTTGPDRTWKVLLINPPFQRLKRVYNVYFPLGLGYIASALKQVGFDCGIYNVENARQDEVVPHNHASLLEQHYEYIHNLKQDVHVLWQEVRDTIRDFKPDIIGVSVMTPCYGSALKVSKIARRIDANIKIIWGGPHPTVQAAEILRDAAEVDFVVMGEGELTIQELCTGIRDGRCDFADVAGIGYRAGNETRVNATRAYVQDLDALPFPDKTASLYMDTYLRDPERAELGNIFGSRGCPFRCAYCSSHTIWGRKVRYRTPESVIEEIRRLQREFGVERFSFLDDTFTINRKWVGSICDGLLKNNVRTRWSCYTRLDVLTEDLLVKMLRSGLAEMDVGIETGSPRMVDFLQKDINLDRAREMAAVLNKRRINWNAFIMMGLPDETVEDVWMTVDFIREIKPLRCILSVFTPYPGDHLFEVCKTRGWIPDKPDWSRFSHHSPENHFVKGISKDEFEQLVREVFTLIDDYNNSFWANYRLFRANLRLYLTHPIRFSQKALAAVNRMIGAKRRKTFASCDVARVSGRGAGI